MKVTEVTAANFKDMVRVAAHRLNKNAEFVNSLNVFPVPDGDTGTNMNLTFQSGAKAVNESTSDSVGELTKALAKGLLMGARGNSGVISSQLFRGFSKSTENKKSLTAQDLAAAFTHGVETAYKAVMKPVEGTILTVAREAAKAGNRKANETDDAVEVMAAIAKGARRALAKTPDQLPVLKEVGVVDSGGQGLVFIEEGFLEGLSGDVTDQDVYQPDETEMDEMVNAAHHQSVQSQLSTQDIKYGYCTEMMIEIGKGPTSDRKFDYDEFRNYLNDLGDSLLVVADDEIIKVHVHTEHPAKIWDYGQHYGSLVKVKIDNMRVQHENIIERDEEEKGVPEAPSHYGIVAVASGNGISDLYKSLGATYILQGGQTMNPSTQDIVDAIQKANAEQLIVLPNNKNIQLAAEQAADLVEQPVAIVPSRSVAQGMTALLSFNPESDLATNKDEMTAALATVRSGQVTRAVRDTQLNGRTIQKNDYMGIVDGDIRVSEPDRVQAAIDMVKTMLDEDSEIVTILIGEDGVKSEAEQISAAVMAADEDLEVEIHEGDQPVYPYLISVE
ncbi:DAK2 domain-containing protein [Lactobacillus selangorensis]|nr:DAK2 domain-containing protein [Lactobacillus selangorensis]